MLKKGNIIEISIEKIVFGGEGLGYYNGIPIFVPMSVPGDVLSAKIISVKKTYARALIEKILISSKDRVANNKISFEDFFGCDFAMLNYDAQLKYKIEMVNEVMQKIGGISSLKTEIIGAENIFNYRNKIIEPFAFKNNKIISGFYSRKSHDIFEVEENILNSKLGNFIIKKLKEILNSKKVSVYDENTGKGLIRNIMIRTNSLNEAMVVLIINSKKVSSKISEILKKLKEEIKEIKSVYVSLNSKKTNVLIGNENILICGEKNIKENIFGINFNISPDSFFQINLEQTKKLYNLALSYFDNIKNKNIIDCYSGTGTIAMLVAKYAKKVHAIEVVKSAVSDAKKTADENNIENINFINGKVEDKILELVKNEKIDAVIFDPPRKGLEKNIIEIIDKANIKEIVYISCNPSTLARDIKLFLEKGYILEKIKSVDMFPQTSHIETVALITKKIKENFLLNRVF